MLDWISPPSSVDAGFAGVGNVRNARATGYEPPVKLGGLSLPTLMKPWVSQVAFSPNAYRLAESYGTITADPNTRER